jgi:hypothetical protein
MGEPFARRTHVRVIVRGAKETAASLCSAKGAMLAEV